MWLLTDILRWGMADSFKPQDVFFLQRLWWAFENILFKGSQALLRHVLLILYSLGRPWTPCVAYFGFLSGSRALRLLAHSTTTSLSLSLWTRGAELPLCAHNKSHTRLPVTAAVLGITHTGRCGWVQRTQRRESTTGSLKKWKGTLTQGSHIHLGISHCFGGSVTKNP